MKNDPIIAFDSPRAWRAWLKKEHTKSTGVWLQLAKKDSGVPSPTYAEALDEALCFGWIDGQKRSHDAKSWLQRFSPRGPRSIWSQINREHVARLISEKKMTPAGLAEVERAKADGRWEAAYASQSRSTVPDDLAAALAKNARAKKFFETLNAANRYAILFRVQTAKKPETRTRRIEQFVAMLAKGEKLH